LRNEFLRITTGYRNLLFKNLYKPDTTEDKITRNLDNDNLLCML
jgi:hypothetical protein